MDKHGLPASESKNMKELTPHRRELMLMVMDGHYELKDLMYLWHKQNRYRKLDEVLEFLVKHRMTGRNLVQYFKVNGPRFNILYEEVLRYL